MPGEPSERIVVGFELVLSCTLAQEQPASLGKTAARLLDLLSAQGDAELGLILPSHSNLQCTTATEAPIRHLPAAVADAQCADVGQRAPEVPPLAQGCCSLQAASPAGPRGVWHPVLWLGLGSLGLVPGYGVLQRVGTPPPSSQGGAGIGA